MIVSVFNIDWDVDNKKDLENLPNHTSIIMDSSAMEDEYSFVDDIADTLSDEYGYCVNNFEYEIKS